MTTAGARVNRLNATARMAAERFGSAADELAARIDSGDCNAKDYATLMCNLIDVGIQSYVGLAEAAIAGPCTDCAEGTESCEGVQSGQPLPSDIITVPAQPYARTLSISDPFTRLGLPAETIAPNLLTCIPSVLPANLTQFWIASADYDLIGANFTGVVYLGSPAGTLAPFPVVVAL